MGEHRREGVVVPTLRRGDDEETALLRSVSRYYQAGGTVSWPEVYPDGAPWFDLPAYAWQRDRFPLGSEQPQPVTNSTNASENSAKFSNAHELALELRAGLATSMDCSPADIDLTTATAELDIESIVVVELKNRIEDRFGFVVPVSLVASGADLLTLAEEILQLQADLAGAGDAPTAPAPSAATVDIDAVGDLTEEEIDALLASFEGGE